MAKPFQLEILTPERAFYRGECISVIVPVSDGMLGIMANHTPMTAAITAKLFSPCPTAAKSLAP